MNRTLIAAMVALLFASTDAFAGANSRFQHCYKIKDTEAKALYTVDLYQNDFRFPELDGCEIKTPAKLLCIDSIDSNMMPPAPGVTGGFSGQKYLCYKAKCPAPVAPLVVGVGDALGVRTVTASKTQLACIPVIQDTCVSAADCRSRPNMASASCNVNGLCEAATCTSGNEDCNLYYGDGCESGTNDDIYNCGDCGVVCPSMNSYPSCTAGVCGLGSCDTDYGDCDLNPGTGCEVYLPSDPNNCGSCNTVCSFPNATAACASSSCVIGSCDAGFADCNVDSMDGCEVNVLGNDVNNCGSCNAFCPGSCNSGICTP